MLDSKLKEESKIRWIYCEELKGSHVLAYVLSHGGSRSTSLITREEIKICL
jgi:hypothetical protein